MALFAIIYYVVPYPKAIYYIRLHAYGNNISPFIHHTHSSHGVTPTIVYRECAKVCCTKTCFLKTDFVIPTPE